MANITTTTAAVFLPDVWAKMAFDAAMFEAKIANNKSGNVTMQAITETKTTLAVSTWKYVAFQLERMPQVQANQDLLELYTQNIGYPLQRAIETSLSGQFNSVTATKGTLGNDPTWDDYRAAWQVMREAGVGEGNVSSDVTWMVSPAMAASAMGLDVFINKNYQSGSNAVADGQIAKLLGWTYEQSNLLNSPAAGQHDSCVYHRDQFLLVQQGGIHIESDYIIEAIAQAVVADTVYGFQVTGLPPETAGGGSAVNNRAVYFKGV